MEIRYPENIANGPFASAVTLRSAKEVVLFDFASQIEGDVYSVVQRVYLAPSALEPLYLELGALLQARRDEERADDPA